MKLIESSSLISAKKYEFEQRINKLLSPKCRDLDFFKINLKERYGLYLNSSNIILNSTITENHISLTARLFYSKAVHESMNRGSKLNIKYGIVKEYTKVDVTKCWDEDIYVFSKYGASLLWCSDPLWIATHGRMVYVCNNDSIKVNIPIHESIKGITTLDMLT